MTAASRFEALRKFNEQEIPRTTEEIEQEKLRTRHMFETPAELLQAPFLTVCSVWPERMISERYTHGGVGVRRYTIEAGSPEHPSYAHFQNTFDLIIQQEGFGEKGYGVRPILAAQYVPNILKFWTGDHIANAVGKKGIGIIRGTRTSDPNNPVVATKAEIEELLRLQVAFLKFMVDRADRNWMSGDPKFKIKCHTKENCNALEMLGLNPEEHEWYRSKVEVKYSPCPYCAKAVPVDAIMCMNCRNEVSRYFLDRDMMPDPEKWPAVHADIQRLKKVKTKV